MQNHLLTVSPPQANEIFCIVCWKRVSLHSAWISLKNVWVFICNSTFMLVHWVTHVLFSILDICSSFYENVCQNFEENNHLKFTFRVFLGIINNFALSATRLIDSLANCVLISKLRLFIDSFIPMQPNRYTLRIFDYAQIFSQPLKKKIFDTIVKKKPLDFV